MAKEKKEQRRTPARWDPFGDLDLLEGWEPFRGGLPSLRRMLDERMPVPSMDVEEEDDRYVLTAELPGVSKNDVDVEVHEGILTLRGEKRSEREEKKGKRRWTERQYGSFARSFRLPPDADAEAVDARFKDGVLTVEIGRSADRKARTVAIKG